MAVEEIWQTPRITECVPSLHDAGLPFLGFLQAETPIKGVSQAKDITFGGYCLDTLGQWQPEINTRVPEHSNECLPILMMTRTSCFKRRAGIERHRHLLGRNVVIAEQLCRRAVAARQDRCQQV